MQCQFNGVARQLKFKATNAKGRQMMKGANKSSSARVTPVISTPMPELKSAKHFLRKLFQSQYSKRPAAKSGETPEGKRREAGH